MSCGCNDFEEIGSCAPFASRADVIVALNKIDSACCVGEYNVLGDKNLPCSSDNAAQEAILEAFPNGITNCNCPCVYLIDNTNNHLSVNCNGDLTLAVNWSCDVDCISQLTTVGLDPSADIASAALTVSEAFPQGLPVDCTEAIVFAQDGTQCFSVDSGQTWSCGSSTPVAPSGGSAISVRWSEGASNSAVCTGANFGAPTTSVLGRPGYNRGCCSPTGLGGARGFINLFQGGQPSVLWDGTGFEAGGGTTNLNSFIGSQGSFPTPIIVDCVVCALSTLYQFSVLFDGVYGLDINIGINGAWNLCSPTQGKTAAFIIVDDTTGLEIYRSANTGGGNCGSSSKSDCVTSCCGTTIMLNMVAGNDYHFEIETTLLSGGCCFQNPGLDVRAAYTLSDWTMEYLGEI